MKKLFFLSLIISTLAFACKKEELVIDNTPIVETPTETTLFSGTFSTGAHTTSGTAKIVEDSNKKRYLVLENLKSDSGPDLRIYVAEDKTIKNATEITTTITIGNSKTEIPASADLNKQKTVLIWCKQFSVLFGSATLK